MINTFASESEEKTETGRRAFLFVHGIGGHYLQFRDLPERAGRYGEAVTFFLPGHGGSFADLLKTNLEDWQAEVDRRLAELSSRYEQVDLIGHSLGTLLVLYAAARNPARVRSLFLWAVPFGVSFPLSAWQLLRHRLIYASPPFHIDPDELFGVPLPTFDEALRLLPKLSQIVRHARAVQTLYPEIPFPMTVFQVRHDELISLHKSQHILEKNQRARIHVLEASTHGLWIPPEDELMRRHFDEWLKETNPPA